MSPALSSTGPPSSVLQSKFPSRSPYIVSAPNSDSTITTLYEFNIGRNLPQGCLMYVSLRDPVTAVEKLLFLDDTFEECAVIGRHEMWDAKLIDKNEPGKGVVVTYTGGRMCSSLTEDFINARKQISLQLNCAQTQDTNFRLIDSQNEYDVLECHAYLEINTPAGCPTGYEMRISRRGLIMLL